MTRTLVIKRVESAGKTFEFNKELVVSSNRFNAVIQFYRSLHHSEGKHGDNDKSYKGEFGFDKFNKSIMAEGLISTYETIGTVVQKNENIKGNHKYLCSYMTIWHPTSVGNADNKKSKATIYIKAEEGGWEKQADDVNNKTIELRVSHPDCITVEGSSSIKMGITIDKKAQPITIECTKFFTQPVEITAHADDHLLGKLIILPNQYTYKTTLQPVLIKFTNRNCTTIIEKEHSDFVKELERRFNQQSFNQAYIYGDLAPRTIVVEFNRGLFSHLLTADGDLDYNKALQYNDLVERRYAAIQNNELESNKAEIELKNKIKAFLDIFDRRFSFTGSGIKYTQDQLKKKVVTEAFNHAKVKKAYDEYSLAKAAYEKAGLASGVNKNGKLHIFMTEDIKVAKEGEGDVLAYAKVESGEVHLFGRLISSNDGIPDAIHELGHALGLRHTFEKDLGTYEIKEPNIRYKKDIEDEITILQNENNRLNERLKNYSKNENADTKRIRDLQNIEMVFYKLLQDRINIKEKFTSIYFENFNADVIEKIFALLNIEITGSSNLAILDNMSNEEIKQNINNNNSSIEVKKIEMRNAPELQELLMYNNKTKSEENYMDYYEDSSGRRNPNMKRTVFSKNQWDTIINVGAVKNNYLSK